MFLSYIDLCLGFILPFLTSISCRNITFSVKESDGVGFKVGKISDVIQLDQSVIFYPIENPYFYVAKDGSITISSNLDRDNDRGLCIEPGFPKICHYSSIVMSSSAEYFSLNFIIHDINDNAPSWTVSNILVEISEHCKIGHTAEIPIANDPDYGNRGVVKYSLMSNAKSDGVFEIISEKENTADLHEIRLVPKLRVLKPLDRENIEWHNLTLIAEDGESPFHKGSLGLNIHVTDENDHTPKFVSNDYRAMLEEYYSVGSLVRVYPYSSSIKSPTDDPNPRFEAIDEDSGDNGRVEYLFSVSTPNSVRETFTLDSFTGQLRIKKEISYEKGPTEWNFDVLAKDNGRPANTGTTNVYIQLVESKNHPPVIKVRLTNESDSKVIHILENSKPSDQSLATITVQDRDEGRDGDFECQLTRNSFKKLNNGEEIFPKNKPEFHLNLTSNLGKIKAYNLFNFETYDREKTPEMWINIYCSDFGKPSFKTMASIQVVIDDLNDNVPKFSQKQYLFRILEEQSSDLLIGQVESFDPDLNNNSRISYQIADYSSTKLYFDAKTMFEINQIGEIRARQRLDRETYVDGFKFLVYARDHGNPSFSSSALVSIELEDINDSIPIFEMSIYQFSVEEDGEKEMPHMKSIGRVTARDSDKGSNSLIRYRFVDRNAPFDIRNDGMIFSKVHLDRETQSTYTLTLLAVDGFDSQEPQDLGWASSPKTLHNTGIATVIINILDTNDNDPLFLQPNSSVKKFYVSYREKERFPITKLIASDKDAGPNGKIHYSIVKGNSKGLFRLLSDTGDLVLAKISDFDQGRHSLTVAAHDNGKPPRMNQTELIITIDDTEPLNTSLNDIPSNDGFDENTNEYNSSLLPSNWDINQIIMVGIVSVCSVVCLLLFIGIFFFARRVKNRSHKRRRTPSRTSSILEETVSKNPFYDPVVQNSNYQILPPARNGDSGSDYLGGSQSSPPISTSFYLQASSDPNSSDNDNRTFQVHPINSTVLQDLIQIQCGTFSRYQNDKNSIQATQLFQGANFESSTPTKIINLGTYSSGCTSNIGDCSSNSLPIVYSLVNPSTVNEQLANNGPATYQLFSPNDAQTYNVISANNVPISFKLIDPQTGAIT